MTSRSIADSFQQAADQGLTLTQLLERTASPDAAMVFLDRDGQTQPLPYSELLLTSQRMGAALRQRGVEAGRPIIICCDDERTLVLSFWAALQAGAIAVPLPVPAAYAQEDEALRKVIAAYEQCEHPLILTDLNLDALSQLPCWNQAIRPERCLALPQCLESDSVDGLVDLPRRTGEDLAMLMFSSGSTGDAKGVRLTHRQILTNLAQISSRSELVASDVSLSWLPLTHDMGLVLFHLCHTLVGLPQFKMTPYSFVREPVGFLEEVQHRGATVLGMPNFGFDLLVRQVPPQTLARLNLSCVRIIYNGAEPIDAALCRRFYAHFEPSALGRGVINPGYGIAEACVTAAGYPHSLLRGRNDVPALRVAQDSLLETGSPIRLAGLEDAEREVVSMGPPVDGMTMTIVDDSGRELPEGHLGHVLISGPNVTQGYWGRPDEPWCATGDMGFLWEGWIYLTGREKDILFINGKNHYSNDLEHRLSSDLQWPANQLAVVGVTDPTTQKERVVIFYRNTREGPEPEHFRNSLEAILAYPVAGALGVATLPKTTSGKIRRFLLRQALLRGDYEAQLAAQNQISISSLSAEEAQVAGVVGELLPGASFRMDPQVHLSRYGLDSVGFMLLAHRLGQSLQRDILLQDLLRAGNLANITQLLQRATGEVIQEAPAIQERVPLTPSQNMLWVAALLEPQSSTYNENYCLRVAADLDVPALLEAARRVLRIHPMLNAQVEEGLTPSLCWREDLTPDVEALDLRAHPQEAETRMERLARQPFDLTRGPLLRLRLLQTGARDFHLFISAHHLVVDGWSLHRLVEELFESYEHPHRALSGERGLWTLPEPDASESVLNGWRSRLEGSVAAQLPGDLPPGSAAPTCGRLVWQWPPALVAQSRKVSEARGVGFFALTMAALGVLFQRLQGIDKPVLGTLLAGRHRHQDQHRVGYFAQTVPLAIHLGTFSQAMIQVQTDVDTLLAAPPLTLGRICQIAEKSPQDLIDVVYVHQNIPPPRLPQKMETLSMRPYRTHARTGLYLTTELRQGALEMAWEYDESRYSATQIRAYAELFEHLLRQLCQRPDQALSHLNVITPAQAILLDRYRDSSPYIDLNWDVMRRFEEVAARHPDTSALSDDAGTYTYAQLRRAIHGLSQRLRNQGVQTGHRICILPDRSCQYVIALLATLHAGAAFIPVDPALPTERLQMILEDGEPHLLLANRRSELPEGLGSDPRLLRFGTEDLEGPDLLEPVPLRGEDGAYLIYTSGSTGRPKGVFNDHKSLANLVAWVAEAFHYQAGETICQFAPFSFDVSIAEILPSLCAGLHVYVLPNERRSSPDIYLETLAQRRIQVATVTPAFFYQLNLLEDRCRAAMSTLRLLILGGEALKTEEVIRFQRLAPHVQVVNVYGPTETTVLSSHYAVPHPPECLKPWQPLGGPVANTELVVLDADRRVCPLGVTGEIHIGGAGLAKGYWKDEAKTEAAFIVFSPDGKPPRRFYRTGDLARLTPEGALEFVGRIDNQIKLRGFRIELGEIETALEACEGLNQAVVVSHLHENGQPALLAYYTGDPMTRESLSAHLRQCLPEYMIPSFFQRLEAFALTPNRKVDRGKLPAPNFQAEHRETPKEAPQGPVEVALAAIWRDILNAAEVGRADRFFEMGGHSLSAAQLAFRIRETFACAFPLAQVYQAPSLRDQAQAIERLCGQASPCSARAMARQPQSLTRFPATEAQARMVFMQLQDPASATNNMPLTLALDAPLDPETLAQALRTLTARHLVLRSQFELSETGLSQVVLPSLEPAFEVVELRDEATLIEACQAFHRRAFAPEHAPLWRSQLLVSHEGKQWLLLNMHHSLSDGVTLTRLLQELDALLKGLPLEDNTEELTYADYAVWQKQALAGDVYSKQEAHWAEQGPHLQPLTLPVAVQARAPSGHQFMLALPPEVSRTLEETLRAQGISPFALVLTAFEQALAASCQQDDFCVGITVGGRRGTELEQVMGLFVNSLPLRLQPQKGETWMAAARRVQMALAELMEGQDYPLNRVMSAAKLEQPPFNVFFNQDILPGSLTIGGVPAQLVGVDTGTAKFPLVVSLLLLSEQWHWRMEYRSDLLPSDWVRGLGEEVLRLLRRCATWPDMALADLLTLDEELMLLL